MDDENIDYYGFDYDAHNGGWGGGPEVSNDWWSIPTTTAGKDYTDWWKSVFAPPVVADLPIIDWPTMDSFPLEEVVSTPYGMTLTDGTSWGTSSYDRAPSAPYGMSMRDGTYWGTSSYDDLPASQDGGFVDKLGGAVSGALTKYMDRMLSPEGIAKMATQGMKLWESKSNEKKRAEAFREAQLRRLPPGWSDALSERSLGTPRARQVVAKGVRPFASGGLAAYVKGGTAGQDDKIPALLSDGEYVMDADVVSALGDGNNEAGAAKLDKMRENIRRHKRSAPAKKIPPKAKAPEQYMKGAK